MLSNQIAISNIKMKTYQEFWQSLTPLYDAGEAQAIVRIVLDVEYIVVGVETGTIFTKVASGVSAHNLSALATIGYKF